MFSKPKVIVTFLALLIISIFPTLILATPKAIVSHVHTHSEPITIGIIVPLEHTALKEIVAGFKEVVSRDYPHSVVFKVENAQGDLKLQRNIIELFVGQKVDMIVPIGTTTTQMTLSRVKDLPVVSLAAQFTEAERQKREPRNVTGVLDEIGSKKKLDLIAHTVPNLKKITVIFHSGNMKNFKEIEELEFYSQKIGVTVQKLPIQTLPELEAAAKAIAKDSQAILVLKDHLVVSGIQLLMPVSEALGIPLVSADEGTVQEGTAFALGVSERAIGEAGGELATKVLQGTPIERLPMQEMQDLTVFYNPKAAIRQKVDIAKLKAYADKNHYRLMAIGNSK